MTSFTSRFLLESVLVPAIVSGLIMFPTRWLSRRVFLDLLPVAAFLASMITAYALIFGWPTSMVLGARQKVFLMAVVSALLGISLDQGFRHRWLLALSLSLGPLWIGWPAISQGRWEALLLLIPITIGLWAYRQYQLAGDQIRQLGWSFIPYGAGLAAIALFGRTASLSQLCLALASTLSVALMMGQKQPSRSLVIVAVAMISGLLSALILYSDASLLAIFVLYPSLLIPQITASFCNVIAIRNSYGSRSLIAVLFLAAAIMIAWIDAGRVSVYEGVQQDEVVFQTFVLAGDNEHDWKDFQVSRPCDHRPGRDRLYPSRRSQGRAGNGYSGYTS